MSSGLSSLVQTQWLQTLMLTFVGYGIAEFRDITKAPKTIKGLFATPDVTPISGVQQTSLSTEGFEFHIEPGRVLIRERYRLLRFVGWLALGLLMIAGDVLVQVAVHPKAAVAAQFRATGILSWFVVGMLLGRLAGGVVGSQRFRQLHATGPCLIFADGVEFGPIAAASIKIENFATCHEVRIETPSGVYPRWMLLVKVRRLESAEKIAAVLRQFIADNDPGTAWPDPPTLHNKSTASVTSIAGDRS